MKPDFDKAVEAGTVMADAVPVTFNLPIGLMEELNELCESRRLNLNLALIELMDQFAQYLSQGNRPASRARKDEELENAKTVVIR